MGEHDFFGLAQGSRVLRMRFGRTLFCHETVVLLRINAGAACENDSCIRETSNKVSNAVTVNPAIRVGAGTRAVHDNIGSEGVFAHRFQTGDINKAQRHLAVPCPPWYLRSSDP